MLWTDQNFVTAADLASIDPDVTATAVAQDIDLPTTIQRGLEDAGRFLEGKLVSFATYVSSNDLSANHLAAVFYTGSQPNQRRRISLEQIVITGRNATVWSELKQWVVNRVLMQFYLSASNRAEGDRYEEKLGTYRKRDRLEAWPALKASGVPIVYRPMPTPAAAWARQPGTWAASAVAGAGTATVAYDVAITFVDNSLYLNETQQHNAQSDPSARKSITLTTGHVIQADITSLLNLPNSQVAPEQLARGFVVQMTASGWNVWVGQTGQALFLQNATPIDIGTKTYVLAGDPVLSGYSAGLGQYAEAFLTIPELINRA